MRASILLAAAAIAGTAALSSSASAQVGVYVGPGYSDYYYYDTPAYPRAYGYNYYYDNDPAYVARRPYGRGGCGVYYFWNGERCVDARWK